MLIELWRKVLANEHARELCGVCGNEFVRGSVFPVAFTDRRESLGEMCPVCLDYLNRRKHDGDDPTAGPAPWGNWPAREWPTLGDLEEARMRYPEAMYPNAAAYDAANPGWDSQVEAGEASVVWRMEHEPGG